MIARGRGSSTGTMARESSLGESLLRSTPKGIISFPSIGSREEENSAMGGRRFGWNEEGDRQGSVYIGGSSYSRGQNLIPRGSVRGNMRTDLKYTWLYRGRV
jgi:hypothetical protein